jgi:hypothetical protein
MTIGSVAAQGEHYNVEAQLAGAPAVVIAVR